MSSSHDCVPAEPSLGPKSRYTVQIEEVLDEDFVRHPPAEAVDGLLFTNVECDTTQSPIVNQQQTGDELAKAAVCTETSIQVTSDGHSKARPLSVEGSLNKDSPCATSFIGPKAKVAFDHSSDKGAKRAWDDQSEASSYSKQPRQRPKSVRFASTDSTRQCPAVVTTRCATEELRFIFFKETRDFNSYRELQESYQVLVDEAEEVNHSDDSKPENGTTFITHSPYTPPATMFDLQYYRVPASYYHTFWHPQRIPIYLHGNVFDGISLTNWIYNWTSYTFKDGSYQMDAVRQFGQTVVKLGSALSDIERATSAAKFKLPRDLYDESGVLWADLENVINDIMSEAEDRLEASNRGGRLEVEFVRRFAHELVAGKKHHRTIEKFLKKTEAWCKVARFHPDFIMLWELWNS